MKTQFATAAALALGSTVNAQVSKKCQDDICFSLNVPQSTGSSGDIFIQMTAPTSMQWVGLGQGSSMSGSNMFVLYTDASGSNVTVSPRLGKGQVEPDFNSDAKITLLEGTGVSNGQMVANIRCETCTSWDGGEQDFSSESGSWIYAYKSGSGVDSDSTSASISEHDSHGNLNFDFSAAKGGSSANPLVSSGSSSGGSCTRRSGASAAGSSATSTSRSSSASSASATSDEPPWASYASQYGSRFGGSRPTGYPSSDNDRRQVFAEDDCEDSDSANGSSGDSTSQGGFSQNGASGFFSKRTEMLMAHGILACLAFVIFFPIGGIIIRVLSFPGLIWVHAAMQVVAYIMFIAAFGIGVYIANNQNMLDEGHVIIGIVLFVLIFFQPFLGLLHHKLYKKYQMRTLWSYGHIWLGRFVIVLGIINGGLGLKLADNTRSGEIAYGVVAGVVGLAYIIAIVYGELKRRKVARDQPPKYSETSPAMEAQRSSDAQPVLPSQHGNGIPMEYYNQDSRRK